MFRKKEKQGPRDRKHMKKKKKVKYKTGVKKREQITVTMSTLKWRQEAALDLFHLPPNSFPFSSYLTWPG